ncbi:hypothetical protein ABPG77_002902 [Micractinium sp. CCAP 211/92]
MEEGQAGTAAASIGAVAPAAPEEAAVAAADDYRKADRIRRRRAKKLAAAGLGGYKPFHEWLAAQAEGVAAFDEFVQRRGLGPARDALLGFIYSSKSDFLLRPPQQPPLRAEVQLDALERSLAGLHLRRGQLAQLLSRRPSLLRAPPSEGALEAVAEALGGRSELAAAALRWPFVLQSSPGSVQRRIEALMLHARCPDPEVAARMVARHPPLLAAPEQAIAENARFLGSLLPTRPYATVVERFPALLAGRLERTLRGLQRHAPERLARVDLTLLVSQQPTLLLGGSRGVLAAWSQLEAVCERVPAWAAQLEALTQPVEGAEQAAQAQRQRGAAEAEAAQQAAQHAQQAERTPEADSWLEDVYRSAGANSGGGSAGSGSDQQPSAPGLLPPIHEAPSWFHQEPEAAAVAERPGAFGSLRRQWREPDRLRVRQLARILDSRPWQRLRLEYLAAEEPEAAAGRDLLDAVVSPRDEFARRHPGFPAWLAARRAADRRAAAVAAAEEGAARAQAAQQISEELLGTGGGGRGPARGNGNAPSSRGQEC